MKDRKQPNNTQHKYENGQENFFIKKYKEERTKMYFCKKFAIYAHKSRSSKVKQCY